jgi:hypothetical protein
MNEPIKRTYFVYQTAVVHQTRQFIVQAESPEAAQNLVDTGEVDDWVDQWEEEDSIAPVQYHVEEDCGPDYDSAGFSEEDRDGDAPVNDYFQRRQQDNNNH